VCDSVLPAQSGSILQASPYLFLFPGAGGYDPKLIEVGTACQEAVRAVQITYPAWRTLLDVQDFDFETLVADAVAQIAQHCPAREILLVGHSFGGLVAFAVAARLRDAGHQVRFLGLFDIEAQPGLDRTPGAPRAPKPHWKRLVGFMSALRRGEGQSTAAFAVAWQLKRPRWDPLLRLYARIPRRYLKGKFTVYLDRDLLSQHMDPLLRQWVAGYDTLRPLPIPVYLFRTGQHSANIPHHLGWASCCPDLTVISVAGNHLSMLGRSNLPIVCAAFQKAVFQVLGRTVPQ